MDYHRIYAGFIKSRRATEHGLKGYVERHHIHPRSLGGGDEPENIIALTPEDHFFAHLLLAKMHGGKMSAALFIMLQVSRDRWERRVCSRGRYGLAKRMALPALSEAWSGQNNPLFNSTLYEWVNYRTGQKETATLFDMHRKYGASRPMWTSVANGSRPSIKGWLLSSRLDAHKSSDKGLEFDFVNRDGRGFRGTQTEFCRFTGLSDASAWRIAQNSSVSRCGWRLRGVADRRFNSPKDGGRSGRTAASVTMERPGKRLTGDRVSLASALGSTPAQVSAAIYAMRNGKVAGYKGWKLVEAETC